MDLLISIQQLGWNDCLWFVINLASVEPEKRRINVLDELTSTLKFSRAHVYVVLDTKTMMKVMV